MCHRLQVIGLPEGTRREDKTAYQGREGMPINAPAIVSYCLVWLCPSSHGAVEILKQGQLFSCLTHFVPINTHIVS